MTPGRAVPVSPIPAGERPVIEPIRKAAMRGNPPEELDMPSVREAVAGLVESDRLDHWLVEAPEPVLIRLMAPLEMLAFQYHREPRQDRHLVRAARVACEELDDALEECPEDLLRAVLRLRGTVQPQPQPDAGAEAR